MYVRRATTSGFTVSSPPCTWTSSRDDGRHLDEPAQGVDLAELLRRPHGGVEQLLAHHHDSQRLGPRDRDVEPVQVVEERDTTRRVLGAGRRHRVDDDRRLLALELV